MSDSFANADDVQVRWRPLSDAEEQTAATLCYDASLMLRSLYPGIDSQVTNGSVDVGVLISVCANMAKRAMIAGGMAGVGVASQSEGVGPYSQSFTFSNPSGNLFVTAAEDQMIRGYQPAGGSFGYGNTTCNSEPLAAAFVYGDPSGFDPSELALLDDD